MSCVWGLNGDGFGELWVKLSWEWGWNGDGFGELSEIELQVRLKWCDATVFARLKGKVVFLGGFLPGGL